MLNIFITYSHKKRKFVNDIYEVIYLENNKKFKKEDTTKYGEFVCSAYHWLPVEKQKEQANKMDRMTKEKNN